MQASLSGSVALLVAALLGCISCSHPETRTTSLDPAATLAPNAATCSCPPAPLVIRTTSPGRVTGATPSEPGGDLGVTSMQGTSSPSAQDDYARPPRHEPSGVRISDVGTPYPIPAPATDTELSTTPRPPAAPPPAPAPFFESSFGPPVQQSGSFGESSFGPDAGL
jgi:hypothetical protein